MKKSKSNVASSSIVPGRTRVDRAETYPGGKDHDQTGGCKNTAAADAATNSTRQGNHRNSGGSAGGNGVIK